MKHAFGGAHAYLMPSRAAKCCPVAAEAAHSCPRVSLCAGLLEARGLWGRAVFLIRQAAQTTATSLLFDEHIPAEKQAAHM